MSFNPLEEKGIPLDKQLRNEATPVDKLETMYLDQQILAHEETLTLMNSYGDSGGNPQLRSFAASTAPVVARHLRHIKAVKAQFKK